MLGTCWMKKRSRSLWRKTWQRGSLGTVVAFVMKTENELEERKGVRDKYEDEANNDCEEMLRIIRMSREAEDEGVAL